MTARFSSIRERGVGMQSPPPEALPEEGIPMSIETVKAQARTLRAELTAPGRKFTQSEALNLLARLAGWANWNAYQPALQQGTAPLPTFEGHGGKLEELLRRRGIDLDRQDVEHLIGTLASPAGHSLPASAWDAAVRRLGGTITLFAVREFGQRWTHQDQLYLETHEQEILSDIDDTRPGLTQLLGEDREALLLADLLHEFEGPGFLAELRDREGQTRWVYVQDRKEAALLGQLHAAAPDVPVITRPGESPVQAAIRRSGLLSRRTVLPRERPSGDLAGLLQHAQTWTSLWTSGHGLQDRLEALRQRHAPTFPWNPPPVTADEMTWELAFLNRAEALSLQARLGRLHPPGRRGRGLVNGQADEPLHGRR